MQNFFEVEPIRVLCYPSAGASTQGRKYVSDLLKESIVAAKSLASTFWRHHMPTAPDQIFRVVPCAMTTYEFNEFDELLVKESSAVGGICSAINVANPKGQLPHKVTVFGFNAVGELVPSVSPAGLDGRRAYRWDFNSIENGCQYPLTSAYAEAVAMWCKECLGQKSIVTMVTTFGKMFDFDHNNNLRKHLNWSDALILTLTDNELAHFKLRWPIIN